MRVELQEFKRDRILEGVLKFFYQRGYHGTTLDVFAERLQVTKPIHISVFPVPNAALWQIRPWHLPLRRAAQVQYREAHANQDRVLREVRLTRVEHFV
jgi:hypothetical protein